MSVKVSYTDDVIISDNDTVKIKRMGDVIEVMHQPSYYSECSIKKLDKDNYVDLKSGEVKQFNKTENRSNNISSVKKSLKRLRDYINTNVHSRNINSCKWVTLTYKENMTDTKILYHDFEKFIKRLRYNLGKCEYIVAMEPQARGSWHAHIVLIFDKPYTYISNDVIWSLWSPDGFKQKSIDGIGYDFTKTQKIDNVDNVGSYLTAYMTDMSIEEFYSCNNYNNNTYTVVDKEIDGEKKSFVKGGRLHMYPVQFNIYRMSRGIKKPDIDYDKYYKIKKEVHNNVCTYKKSIKLESDEFNKTITYEYYNTQRKK